MTDLGALTAHALRGSWREAPSSTLSAGELAAVTPHLLASGCGGLGWWAVRDASELATTAASEALADACRLHQLHGGLHDKRLDAVLGLSERLAIDPVVVKGATIARRYPARGLRPYGDVDLVVRPDERERLRAALDARPLDADWVDVDLDHAFLAADGSHLEDLRARSVTTMFGERAVRTLGSEDELRLVCLHYLRAGGFRALSLCDVALLIETRPAQLDWSIVLPAGRVGAWVAVTAALARDLLGADLHETPLAAARTPAWVRAHVLRRFADTNVARRPPPPFSYRAKPSALADQLRKRWPPDALELTLHHRRKIRRRRPGHLQVYDLAGRGAAKLIPRLPVSRAPGTATRIG